MKKLNVNPDALNAALVHAQKALRSATQTVEAINQIASSIDVKRIERALEFVEQCRQQVIPHTKQSHEESKSFALDRSTRDEIRYRYSIGVPIRRLAEDFGIGRTTVRRYLSHNR